MTLTYEAVRKTVHLANGIVVQRFLMGGRESVGYVAYEPATSTREAGSSHGTMTTLDREAGCVGQVAANPAWLGKVATRRLTPALDALPARTEERSKAVGAFHESNYAASYAAIEAAFPETRGLGFRCMGDIHTDGAEVPAPRCCAAPFSAHTLDATERMVCPK